RRAESGRRRHRRARLHVLEPARQLRMGVRLHAQVRARVGRPHHVRTDPQTERPLARPDREGERTLMASILDLTTDELLTTTRAVRKRVDFDKPVPLDVVRECIDIATQAPTGSNQQGWHWMVVTDATKRAALGETYQRAF